jgi:hypothetical protein
MLNSQAIKTYRLEQVDGGDCHVKSLETELKYVLIDVY